MSTCPTTRITTHTYSDIAKPKFGLGMTKEDDPWFRAKKIELTAMDEHQVWDVVDYSPGMKRITCKWVLSDKFDAQGISTRRKLGSLLEDFNNRLYPRRPTMPR